MHPLDSEYECKFCQDTEFIYDKATNTAKYCSCKELKYYKRLLEHSGISEEFKKKTLDDYNAKNDMQKAIKQMAVEYIINFDNIKHNMGNSILLTGQVGSGKTHITIAIGNALLNKGVGVLYMQFVEAMTKLKQIKMDEEMYAKEINMYKNATVLLIDDLFKDSMRNGKIPESELSIMFEIINFRYLKHSPILVSSEYTIDQLIRFNEGTGSRIAQMCAGRTKNLIGKELNHRIPQNGRF